MGACSSVLRRSSREDETSREIQEAPVSRSTSLCAVHREQKIAELPAPTCSVCMEQAAGKIPRPESPQPLYPQIPQHPLRELPPNPPSDVATQATSHVHLVPQDASDTASEAPLVREMAELNVDTPTRTPNRSPLIGVPSSNFDFRVPSPVREIAAQEPSEPYVPKFAPASPTAQTSPSTSQSASRAPGLLPSAPVDIKVQEATPVASIQRVEPRLNLTPSPPPQSSQQGMSFNPPKSEFTFLTPVRSPANSASPPSLQSTSTHSSSFGPLTPPQFNLGQRNVSIQSSSSVSSIPSSSQTPLPTNFYPSPPTSVQPSEKNTTTYFGNGSSILGAAAQQASYALYPQSTPSPSPSPPMHGSSSFNAPSPTPAQPAPLSLSQPNFPHTRIPRCKKCGNEASAIATSTDNQNGNEGRPYYRCTGPSCKNNFVVFNDAVGIHPDNPPCRCSPQKPSRQLRYGISHKNRGKGFWNCSTAECGYWSDRENGGHSRTDAAFYPWLLRPVGYAH